VFNINGWEFALIGVLFLLLFGPERIPEVALQLGKLLRELRQMTEGATAELTRELELAARELNEPLKTVRTDKRAAATVAERLLTRSVGAAAGGAPMAADEPGAPGTQPPGADREGPGAPEIGRATEGGDRGSGVTAEAGASAAAADAPTLSGPDDIGSILPPGDEAPSRAAPERPEQPSIFDPPAEAPG
jgi:sec-independent protein translocase protein TatB